MKKQGFVESLTNKAKVLGIELSKKQIEQFYQYMELLILWNQKMNLTAIIEPEEIILKHFIDSLSIYPIIKEKQKILDIGTGAGFPGIPLKIVTQGEFTLLDSLNKRITFLQEVIKQLELKEIRAIHGRAEEFIKQNKEREYYEIVTSRAVARLNVLIEYMLPFAKVGGKCICMKAANIQEELEEAKKAILILGGEIEKIEEMVLPQSDIKRTIISIRKVKQSPKQYPRKAGIPAKEPLI